MSRMRRTLYSFVVIALLGCVTSGKVDVQPPAGKSFTDKHLDYKKWNRTSACCTTTDKRVAIAQAGQIRQSAGRRC